MRRDFAGLSITDHDTLKGSLKALKIIREEGLDLILIPGAEVTTTEGHLLVLGVQELPPRGRSPEETSEMARSREASPSFPILTIPSACHRAIPDCDAVEVYNSKHLFGMPRWTRRDAKKRHLPMVAEVTHILPPTVGWGHGD